jgi:site-specific DNA-methyltransferase (adenine-specific)
LGQPSHRHGQALRRRGDYLVILHKEPIVAKTWTDHGIPSRWSDGDESKETDALGVPRLWPEKVDRKVHPHAKPIGFITRLIAAVTKPGDLVVDPAAGSFVVMQAALEVGRDFIGCDCEWREPPIPTGACA